MNPRGRDYLKWFHEDEHSLEYCGYYHIVYKAYVGEYGEGQHIGYVVRKVDTYDNRIIGEAFLN